MAERHRYYPKPLAERVRLLLDRLPPRRRAVFIEQLRYDVHLELKAARQDVALESA